MVTVKTIDNNIFIILFFGGLSRTNVPRLVSVELTGYSWLYSQWDSNPPLPLPGEYILALHQSLIEQTSLTQGNNRARVCGWPVTHPSTPVRNKHPFLYSVTLKYRPKRFNTTEARPSQGAFHNWCLPKSLSGKYHRLTIIGSIPQLALTQAVTIRFNLLCGPLPRSMLCGYHNNTYLYFI